MSEISQSQLETLCAACGWQGGTFWQVVDEIRRLKTANETALRDTFAGQAMSGYISTLLESGRISRSNPDEVLNALAKVSYRVADAMIEARKGGAV